MGGGGAMRSAAAKIAGGIGSGVSKAPFRPGPTEQAVRNAARPTAVAGVSSTQGAKSAEVAPLSAAVTWDDWDFADDGDSYTPRMVFGSVPTIHEAKEATAELKDAIDQVYLSPESSQHSSSPGGHVFAPALNEPMNKSVIETISNPLAPRHAIQAFHLLSSSTEAQAVVASLACDPNVWTAVMENPAVSSFFLSQQTVENNEEVDKLFQCDSETVQSPDALEGSAESHPGNMFSDLMNILQNVKLTVKLKVIELVSKASAFLHKIFPAPEASSMDGMGIGGGALAGQTFVGLAVMVIVVILTKRV